MPLSGPDTSGDVRLCAVSEETAGLGKSKPLALGLSGPPGRCGSADAAATAAYVATPSGGPSYRPPGAATSSVLPGGAGVEPMCCTGRLTAGSGLPSGPAGSVAFRFGGRLEGTGAWRPLPPAVARGLVDPLSSMTLFSASMNSGEICKEEKASRKARCSVLSMAPEVRRSIQRRNESRLEKGQPLQSFRCNPSNASFSHRLRCCIPSNQSNDHESITPKPIESNL
jgi:hypothetical protein